ncbi:MAG: type II toxin-antitoxin system HipA family toxin [Rubrivivax sp.]|nr:MAG: type II toxin-antitoxin system HipA family toxin [Rubrivivax sp.]
MTDEAYAPRDSLGLWWLAEPQQPRAIGTIALQQGGRGVTLRYAPAWIASGWPLSEDLPLTADLFIPHEKDTAAGAVDDARPDRWGERVIRKFERSPRLSLLEFLLFAGDDRYGALGVSLQPDRYEPWQRTPLPTLDSLDAMAETVRRVLANEPVDERHRRLVQPGVSLGGARPKSLMVIDQRACIVKFGEGEEIDTPLIEHATMTLARQCGIDTAPTRPLPVGARHAVAVERFDRLAGRRLHAVSAHVALRAAGESEMSYVHLAQLLRRVAPADQVAAQQAQLFRRMVFNILMDNTDDHEKNHALLRQADGQYLLSPAFDMVPSASGLGYQAMSVGPQGTASTLDNALTGARLFGLSKDAAHAIVTQVCAKVRTWKAHFGQIGVAPHDIALLAQYLDGSRLAPQRDAFA